jgi:predicted GH43/DUF377 family glycosyl hydrolase
MNFGMNSRLVLPFTCLLAVSTLSAQDKSCSFSDWEWCEFNPILGPRGGSWEAQMVFDGSALVKDNRVHLFYRGEEFSDRQAKPGKASIGLAVSENGIDFKRRDRPVLAPSEPYELPGGCFHPRVVEFAGTYYMTYSGYNGKEFQLALATSQDLVNWKKHGPIFPGRPNTKSGVIVPEKINGRYAMYFGEGKTWIAYSEDLLHWKADDRPVLSPRPEQRRGFDTHAVEPGAPPIMTSRGILLLCNGLAAGEWSIGEVFFSATDPAKVVSRTNETCLVEPSDGGCAGGAFGIKMYTGGLVFFANRWHLYYGYEDTYVSLARSRKARKF